MSTPNEPKSWRTSVAGWATLLGALGTAVAQFLADGTVSIEPVLLALTGLGLLAARDQKAHDEAK